MLSRVQTGGIVLAALILAWAAYAARKLNAQPAAPPPGNPPPITPPPINITFGGAPEPIGRGSLGPLQQVGAIGNVDPSATAPGATSDTFGNLPDPLLGQLDLCQQSPLMSFGPACAGITWGLDPATGMPIDYRTNFGGFGTIQ